MQDLTTGQWSSLEEYVRPGGWEKFRRHWATVKWSDPTTYPKEADAWAVGGAVAGVVALGGGALGLAPAVISALSGFSVGATQTAAANVLSNVLPEVKDVPWHVGVVQSAFVGAMGGAAAGGITGAIKPQSLAARMAVGGLVGGGVSGGTHVAINVATGRPWDEGLGQAISVGLTTGTLDAFMDYYGDQWMEGQLGKRPVRSLAEDAADPVVRRALQVWNDPGASCAEKIWASRRLLEAGVPGVWRGGLPADPLDAEAPRPRGDVAEPRQRTASLLRRLGVGVAGVKKHVRAWFSRETPRPQSSFRPLSLAECSPIR